MKKFLIAMLLFGLVFKGDNGLNLNEENYSNKIIDSVGSNNQEKDINVTIRFKEKDLQFIDELVLESNEKTNMKANYITKNNEMKMKKFNLKNIGFDSSKYAPFVFAKYTNDEYDKYSRYIKSLVKFKEIEKIYIAENVKSKKLSASYSESLSTTEIPISYAKSMIKVDGSAYTGDGIKIGVLEDGIPILNDFKQDSIGGYDHYLPEHQHTHLVSSIIGGEFGIATDAKLYYRDFDDYKDSLEYMVENVDVVNISDTFEGQYGWYSDKTAYTDYISKNYDLIIVAASGNNETGEYDMIQPATGLNVFTVGSVDYNKKVSSYSSYNVTSSVLKKYKKYPNLVAPGENIRVGDYCDFGTSFSAPMVTGTIALLLEEFPQFKSQKEVVLAALMNGATKLDGQTNLMDERAGAGLLNYHGAREILSNSNFLTYNVNSNAVVNDVVGTYNFTIPANSFLDMSFVRLYNSNVASYGLDLALVDLECDTHQFEIYDEGSNNLIATFSAESNVGMLSISNAYPYQKNYIIKIKLIENSIENTSCSWVLTFLNHMHIYSTYVSYDSTRHKCICSCGEYVLANHVWTTTSLKLNVGNKIQYIPKYVCTSCGYSTTKPPSLIM